MNYFLLETKYDFWLIAIYFFTSLLLLYFGEVKKLFCEVNDDETNENVLGSVSYGSELLPLVCYYRNINVYRILFHFSVVLLLKYIFLVLFFYLSKIIRQYFSLLLE